MGGGSPPTVYHWLLPPGWYWAEPLRGSMLTFPRVRRSWFSRVPRATWRVSFSERIRERMMVSACPSSLAETVIRRRKLFQAPQGERAEATAFWQALPARMAPQTHRTRPVNSVKMFQ